MHLSVSLVRPLVRDTSALSAQMAMIMGSLHAPLSEASHKTHDIYKASAKY